MWCPTYGYLPSYRDSHPPDRDQIILLGRHVCEHNLPKVVAWKQNGRYSNLRPFICKSSVLTVTAPVKLCHCVTERRYVTLAWPSGTYTQRTRQTASHSVARSLTSRRRTGATSTLRALSSSMSTASASCCGNCSPNKYRSSELIIVKVGYGQLLVLDIKPCCSCSVVVSLCINSKVAGYSC